MQKICDSIYDIIAFSNGIIYTRKKTLQNGSARVSFYGYDIKRMQNTPVTKSVYLLNKFGPEYKKIAEQLGDYVSCDADILPSKQVVVVYPSGETGFFSPTGEMTWSSDLLYQGCDAELRRKQNDLQQDNQKLHEELRQIRELVKNDAVARDTQLRKLSGQLEKLANMPVPTVPAVTPGPAPAPNSPLTPVTENTPEEYEVYIVEKGATLSVIARVYGVSVSEIKRANKLKSDLLKINQKLLIPVKKK